MAPLRSDKSSLHAVVLQVETNLPGEDDDGDFYSTPIDVPHKAVVDALVERLRDGLGLEFKEVIEVQGVPTLVTIEWQRSWLVDPKEDGLLDP